MIELTGELIKRRIGSLAKLGKKLCSYEEYIRVQEFEKAATLREELVEAVFKTFAACPFCERMP